MVMMTLNHWPGHFSRYTSQPIGLVSAAEGFIFVSGLTAGIVFSRIAADQGASQVRSRAFGRSGEIYQAQVFFLAVIFAAGLVAKAFHVLPLSWVEMIPFFEDGPLRGLLLGATLLFQPKYFNILPLYIFLLLLVPPVIGCFVRKKFVAVFVVSSGMWAMAQFGLTEFVYERLTRNLGYEVGLFFDPLAWQFLFVIGLWMGHKSFLGVSLLSKNRVLLVVCLLVAVVLMWYRYQLKNEIYPIESLLGVDMSNWVSRSKLGPIRLLNFLVLCQLFGVLIARYPRLFVWRWSCFLGRYSLQVFCFHLLLIYFAYGFREIVVPEADTNLLVGISALGAVSLFIPAYLAQWLRRVKIQE